MEKRTLEFISADMLQGGYDQTNDGRPRLHGKPSRHIVTMDDEIVDEEPPMSTLEGTVRFLSIVFVCGPILFSLAIFVDMFFQNINLPFTNASALVIALVSVGAGCWDYQRNSPREEESEGGISIYILEDETLRKISE